MKYISSDIIIGNYLIEAIEKFKHEIFIDDLIIFDRMISEKLNEEYCTIFSLDGINNFEDTYPFFIVLGKNGKIIIKIDYNNKFQENELKECLNSYFRIGLPTDIVNVMKLASESITV